MLVEKEGFGSEGQADWSVKSQALVLHLLMSQQFGLEPSLSLRNRVLFCHSLLHLLATSSPH